MIQDATRCQIGARLALEVQDSPPTGGTEHLTEMEIPVHPLHGHLRISRMRSMRS